MNILHPCSREYIETPPQESFSFYFCKTSGIMHSSYRGLKQQRQHGLEGFETWPNYAVNTPARRRILSVR
jgi:hypothetical protein